MTRNAFLSETHLFLGPVQYIHIISVVRISLHLFGTSIVIFGSWLMIQIWYRTLQHLVSGL